MKSEIEIRAMLQTLRDEKKRKTKFVNTSLTDRIELLKWILDEDNENEETDVMIKETTK